MWFKRKTKEEKIQDLEEKLAYKKAKFRYLNNAITGQKVPLYKIDEIINMGAEIEKLECRLKFLKTNP